MDHPVVDAVLNLATRGSDELVAAVYRRICADRAAGHGAPRDPNPAKSWRQLARMAVAEGVLTAREARRLGAMEAVSAPGPRSHPSASRAASGRRYDGSLASRVTLPRVGVVGGHLDDA